MMIPKKFEFLRENTKISCIYLNPDNKICDCNKATEELLGYTREELIHMNFSHLFISTKQVGYRIQNLSDQSEKSISINCEEIQIKKKNGYMNWIRLTSSPVINKSGDLVANHLILVDIDDIKKKEQEQLELKLNLQKEVSSLKKQYKTKVQELDDWEDKYRIIIENVDDLIVVLDKNLDLLYINQRTTYTREEIIGMNANYFTHPEDHDAFFQMVENMKKKGESRGEIRVVDKNGNFDWMEVKARRMLTDDENSNIFMVLRDINQRKRSEEKLRESEEKFRIIADQSLVGILIITEAQQIVYVNEASAHILGYSAEEIKKIGIVSLIYNDTLVKEKIKHSFTSKPSYKLREFHFQIQDRFGQIKWLEMHANKIKIKGTSALLVMFVDKTESENAKLQLWESEQKYLSILNNLTDYIYVVNKNNVVTFFNDSLRNEMQSFLDKEITEENFFALLSKFPTSNIFPDIENVFHTGKVALSHYDVMVKNQPFIAEVRRIPMKTGNEVESVITVVKNFTNEKVAEKRVEESERTMSFILENVQDAIVAVSEENEIIYKNKKAIELSKRIGPDASSRYEEFLKRKSTHPLSPSFNESGKEQNGTRRYEVKALDKDNKEIYLEIHSTPGFISNGKKTIIEVVRDVTPQKQIELMIKQENKKLKELDELRNELIIRTSHELKTPLISISNASSILLQKYHYKFDDTVKELLEIINNGGNSLEELINGFIQIAQLENGAPKLQKSNVCFKDIVDSVLSKVKVFAKKRRVLIYHEKTDCKISLDKTGIEQVISHLLINGIKNTPPGGKISIQYNQNETNDLFEIIITDTGVGFTKEEKKRVFTKFGKLERYGVGLDIDTEGSGIGLYVCKKLIENHGGEIWVESPGRNMGSIFQVTIPLV